MLLEFFFLTYKNKWKQYVTRVFHGNSWPMSHELFYNFKNLINKTKVLVKSDLISIISYNGC